jgi:OOP family OmpA-OmpF porin
MIIKNAGVFLCALLSQFSVTAAIAEQVDEDKQRSWYLGAGFGITELDPDTNDTGYSVSDERDSGFKLFGGYDYSETLTVEGFYTDMGSAQLTSPFPSQPDGKVDYSTLGASVLWYFWRNGENKDVDGRKGLQAYLHGGLSFLNNSSSVEYSQDNSVQVQYGAGLEYGLDNYIALRAGLDLYDKDAGMVFVGVLKRFGIKSKRKVVSEPEPVIEPVVEPVAEVVATQEVVLPEVVVTYDIDSDNDGVVDRLDDCADSPAGLTVDDKGCSIIEFQFSGVNFEPRSYELTKASKLILDEAAITINASPELQVIEVQAHTDYKGSGDANLELSEKRASSVRDYLVSRGVSENRLVAKGYGESRPIADNKTEEGRAKNRRVELKVITDKPSEPERDPMEPEDTESEPLVPEVKP